MRLLSAGALNELFQPQIQSICGSLIMRKKWKEQSTCLRRNKQM